MEFLKKIFCFPFTKTRSKNENIIVNNTNFVNSNNKSNNSDNLNDDLDAYERLILNQKYGLCPECKQPNTHDNWCKECYSKKFQQNFGNWTSGNGHVDKFIQDAQLNARNW